MITSDNAKRIKSFVQGYLEMDLGPITVHCPYWMNKIQDGKVAVRGKFNGKGTSKQIKKTLLTALRRYSLKKDFTPEFIRKLAKRQRIGIDCSGLVYRTLKYVLTTKSQKHKLNEIFPEGVNKTNSDMLTNRSISLRIGRSKDIRSTDLIRMNGGHHVLLVIQNDGKYIEYIHSSDQPKINGVHKGKIKIINPEAQLDKQQWLERTISGDDFGKKYFNPKKGDGVRRLKIFN